MPEVSLPRSLLALSAMYRLVLRRAWDSVVLSLPPALSQRSRVEAIEFVMPLLKLETWKSFQAPGKRSVLSRGLILGLVCGAAGGVAAGFVVASSSTRHLPLATSILIMVLGTATVSGVLVFLVYFLLWELLRRKFSQS